MQYDEEPQLQLVESIKSQKEKREEILRELERAISYFTSLNEEAREIISLKN